jgi:hypothetical protein
VFAHDLERRQKVNYRDPSVWIDVITEFFFNGANFTVGYMVATGQMGAITTPSGVVWLAAGLAGVIGSANHIRALRKVTP